MDRRSIITFVAIYAAVAGIGLAAWSERELPAPAEKRDPGSFIVEAASIDDARAAVLQVGGEITHELGIIDAVAALMTPEQMGSLSGRHGLRISANAEVETAGKPGGKGPGGDSGGDGGASGGTTTGPATLTGATQLHQQGITGWGVGIAVVDSGSMSHVSLNKNPKGDWRFFAQYDAITDEVVA